MTKVIEVMRFDLDLDVQTTPEQFLEPNAPDKLTVLLLLDKLRSHFRNQKMIGSQKKNNTELIP